MNNVYLFQPQSAVYVNGQVNYWLPYSAGIVWSYVNQFLDIQENFQLGKIFYRRESTEAVLQSLDNPKLVGFSCYVWNENYCLNIARKIKKQWPNCVIVFGGAQSSSKLLKHNFIDSIILAEGEESFLEILRAINQEKTPEILYNKKRMNELNIPSPYSTGVFDHLIKENPNTLWAATLETNRGCPYACTFCDWGGVTYSKVKKFNLERIAEELDWISKHRVVYLAVADANFGIFKERDLEIAKLIRIYSDRGMIDAVNLQYAKNNTEQSFEIAKVLGPYNRGITVSVQSMNPNTLKAIKRDNLEVNDIAKLMKISTAHNVPTYTEVILGLPLETEETWRTGVTELLELGQHTSIDLSFTEILENSELNTFESRQLYKLKTIKAEQFYNITRDEYPEHGEIVVSTSTMSTDEMAQCYMYAWMIIHLHVTGYTQLFAKFLRNIDDVSYREFYDKMFELLTTGNSTISNHYQIMLATIETYLKTGKLTSEIVVNQRGDTIHFASHEFFYANQQQCIELGLETFKYFNQNYKEILELQQNAIYNNNQSFPITIKSNIDVSSWTIKPSVYRVTNDIKNTADFLNKKIKLSDNSSKPVDFWALRRKNLLKNRLEIIG